MPRSRFLQETVWHMTDNNSRYLPVRTLAVAAPDCIHSANARGSLPRVPPRILTQCGRSGQFATRAASAGWSEAASRTAAGQLAAGGARPGHDRAEFAREGDWDMSPAYSINPEAPEASGQPEADRTPPPAPAERESTAGTASSSGDAADTAGGPSGNAGRRVSPTGWRTASRPRIIYAQIILSRNKSRSRINWHDIAISRNTMSWQGAVSFTARCQRACRQDA